MELNIKSTVRPHSDNGIGAIIDALIEKNDYGIGIPSNIEEILEKVLEKHKLERGNVLEFKIFNRGHKVKISIRFIRVDFTTIKSPEKRIKVALSFLKYTDDQVGPIVMREPGEDGFNSFLVTIYSHVKENSKEQYLESKRLSRALSDATNMEVEVCFEE